MGEAGACSVMSLPQIEIRSGDFGSAAAATAPSNGIRIACTRSGSISEINLRACFAARRTVAGPSQCRRNVRSGMVREEVRAPGRLPLAVPLRRPLKATGTMWSVSRPFRSGQAEVEIRWTLDASEIKWRIQFRAMGLLPSAINSKFTLDGPYGALPGRHPPFARC